MRFCYYKLVNDLCKSLVEAVSYILGSGDTSLWSVCTEAVTTIENTLSVNRDTVGSERLFSLCGEIKENVSLCETGNDKGQALIDGLTELIPLCRDELNYRLRVLFVADLGGKWDSMDSVYRAFKERGDCDIDVVIQPIFRQKTDPDGTTRREVICDDYLTPMGIKNIPYQEYDMEKIAPDMTFISQPYESVTIPMFWPENIAKVSRLVYLPYYNATTLDTKISPAFESFFVSNTQKYSWKIACQSEIMKKYYEKYASEKGKNVIVTGLPKWDYPLKLNKSNTPCPEKWRKKIEGKKVFLWNTHFNPSTQGISILDQGIDFLRLFSENKSVALIWRPHPMMETVIKVYYPQKLSSYKKIIKFISDSNNLIIDKNSTYDCSFVWSDALISDDSSIVDLYLLLDKPIILTSSLNQIQTKNKYYTDDGLFDYLKLPWACSMNDIQKYINDVVNGNDISKENREILRNNYYSLADEKCGERVANYLINGILSE